MAPAKLRDIWSEIEELSATLEKEANLASSESKKVLSRWVHRRIKFANSVTQSRRQSMEVRGCLLHTYVFNLSDSLSEITAHIAALEVEVHKQHLYRHGNTRRA
jgi:hypothetical protein